MHLRALARAGLARHTRVAHGLQHVRFACALSRPMAARAAAAGGEAAAAPPQDVQPAAGASAKMPSAVSRFLTRSSYASPLTALGVSICVIGVTHVTDVLGLVTADARQIAAAAALTNAAWCGFNASITCMEAWVKFQAPSVPRRVALDVGRHVFSALNKVEIGLASASVYLWLLDRGQAVLAETGVAGGGGAVFAGAVPSWLHLLPPALLVLQTGWLGPALMSRARVIAETGRDPPPSRAHSWYALTELVKLAALAAAAKGCVDFLL